MKIQSIIGATSAEEAEKILRSEGFPVDIDALAFVTGRYFDEGNDYKAMALTLDYFAIVKDSALFPKDPNDYITFVEDLYSSVHKEGDCERTLLAGALLADAYKGRNDTKMLALGYGVTRLCGSPQTNSTHLLIAKEAISAAVSIIEAAIDEPPIEQVILIMFNMINFLPGYCRDVDFIMSTTKRIADMYQSSTEAQRGILAALLPELERTFNGLLELLNINWSGEDSASVRTLTKCRDMLFNENTPKPLPNQKTYKILGDYMQSSEYLRMIAEKRKLASDIEQARWREDRDWLPEYKKRLDYIIDYFTSSEQGTREYDDISHLCMVIETIALWLDFDFSYTYDKLQPHIEELFAIQCSDRLSTNSTRTISSAYWTLSDVYAVAEHLGVISDMKLTYDCFINFFKFGNQHLKSLCFEQDMDFFARQVKDEYFFHHDSFNHAITLLKEHNYPVSDLYIELCKRKNHLYLGEMWQRGHGNIADINRLIQRDFSIADIHAAIPENAVMIDFMFYRKWFMDNDHNDGTAKDPSNAYGIAFILDSKGGIRYKFVGKGDTLSTLFAFNEQGKPVAGSYLQYLYDNTSWEQQISDTESPNAVAICKELTENLLSEIQGITNIILCSEGEFNTIAFSSLPYKDGFIIDYFSVRNIASVYDVVQPRSKRPIENALIFNAPDFGTVANGHTVWHELIGSELEGQHIESTFKKAGGITVTKLSDTAATTDKLRYSLNENNYSIIHLSTHGHLEAGKIGLVTANANNDNSAMLWDYELGQYSMAKTTLTVYALCFGANQTSRYNDSLSGFIKFSLISGVNSVIAPLHPIEDLSTVVLLDEFYKHYMPGENPEIALQKAIRRLRTIGRTELMQEYDIDADDEFPFETPEHWAQWVCFSAEQMN